VIHADKTKYLLDIDPGKAKGFAEMGYTMANSTVLENMLIGTRAAIDLGGEYVATSTTEWGMKKTVEVFIVGPSGREGLVQVTWMMKKGKGADPIFHIGATHAACDVCGLASYGRAGSGCAARRR
jgi:hypothetical protein